LNSHWRREMSHSWKGLFLLQGGAACLLAITHHVHHELQSRDIPTCANFSFFMRERDHIFCHGCILWAKNHVRSKLYYNNNSHTLSWAYFTFGWPINLLTYLWTLRTRFKWTRRQW
jgi:hypothetical protein